MTHLRTTEGIARSEASMTDMMLGESAGLGAFGKGRSRRWYKQKFNRTLRRLARVLAALSPERES